MTKVRTACLTGYVKKKTVASKYLATANGFCSSVVRNFPGTNGEHYGAHNRVRVGKGTQVNLKVSKQILIEFLEDTWLINCRVSETQTALSSSKMAAV